MTDAGDDDLTAQVEAARAAWFSAIDASGVATHAAHMLVAEAREAERDAFRTLDALQRQAAPRLRQRRDYAIADAVAAGHPPAEVATAHNLSPARISQIVKQVEAERAGTPQAIKRRTVADLVLNGSPGDLRTAAALLSEALAATAEAKGRLDAPGSAAPVR